MIKIGKILEEENNDTTKSIINTMNSYKGKLVIRDREEESKVEYLSDILYIILRHGYQETACSWYYADKNIRRNQHSGSSRSLHDIFNLVNTYIPEITVKHVKTCLDKFCKGGRVRSWYCPNIRRRVYMVGAYTVLNIHIIREILNMYELELKIKK